MNTSTTKPRTKPTATALAYRRVLKEAFPETGKVRPTQISAHLGIGLSTWWLYVNQGRVLPPVKFGKRVSVWDAEYIRWIAKHGIPDKQEEAA